MVKIARNFLKSPKFQLIAENDELKQQSKNADSSVRAQNG